MNILCFLKLPQIVFKANSNGLSLQFLQYSQITYTQLIYYIDSMNDLSLQELIALAWNQYVPKD